MSPRSALRWLLRPRRGDFRPLARVALLALVGLAVWAGPVGAQIGTVGEGQVSQPAGQDLSEPVRVATVFLTRWGAGSREAALVPSPVVTVQGRHYSFSDVRLIPPFSGLTAIRAGAAVLVGSLTVETKAGRRTAPATLTLIRHAGAWHVSAVEVQ